MSQELHNEQTANDVLKILHVISGDLWAGAEAQAYTLMSSLALISGIEVAAATMNDGELASRLRHAGITVFVLNENTRGSIDILFHLRDIMAQWSPQIIHTHREKENVLGSIANWWNTGVPSVRTVHGGPERPAGMHVLNTVRRLVIEKLDRWCAENLQDRIIVVSKELATRLSQELPTEKMVVIENGVDAARLIVEAGVPDFRNNEPTCRHIGLVGRLVNVKRVDLFLKTAALLASTPSKQPWRFHVFGDGPLRAELETMSRELKITSFLRFHGHKRDIATCIAGLDALVMCSDHEGLPMTALEAAALGVPLVAHAVGAMPEITPTEFLVTEHTPAAYARGILRSIQDDGKEIARKMAEGILAKHSAEANAQRVLTLYRMLAAHNSATNFHSSPAPSDEREK